MHDDRRANFSDNGSNNDNRPPQGSPPNKPDDNFDWGKIIRMVMVWGFIIVAAVVVMQLFKGDTGRAVEIKYKQYERLLNEDKIETATITKSEFNDYYFKGELGSPTDLAVDGKGKTVTEFVVYIPEPMIEEQEKLWAEKGIDYSFDKESGEWVNYLVTMLPWILIIVVWIFFMRRMQGGGAGGQRGLFNFGKSKAKLINQLGKKATFKDVAGA
ncbi:MAG: cell division protein FtsH, partial [Ignavibacteriales bacterium]|nr:cell division protein FtsH [Ignavibacteriales bacterium]